MSDMGTVVSLAGHTDTHPTTGEHTLPSPSGALRILRTCSPDMLRTLTLDPGIGRFARYRSIIAGIETLEKVAGLPDANVTITLSPSQHIVGYIECCYPDVIEGWHDNMDDLCYELGAIEVSRNWRRLGIARAMVATILADEFVGVRFKVRDRHNPIRLQPRAVPNRCPSPDSLGPPEVRA